MSFRRAVRSLQRDISRTQPNHQLNLRAILLACGTLLLILSPLCAARAQTTEARITVISTSPARVKVEGRRASATRVWSFRNVYAGLMGLGERIENLSLSDAGGASVPVRKLAAGEYESASAAISWSYEVKLDPPVPVADSAYASWIAGERGFLMLGDLLPRKVDEREAVGQTARISLSLPANWKAVSGERRLKDFEFEVAETEDAIFFVGTDLRERRERIGPMEFSLAMAGTWAFPDDEVLSMAHSILKDYTERVGPTTRTRAMLMLAPFPANVSAERWSAETRGGCVLLLSGQSPSKLAGLAQLSTPLTHELFHLWVPNGLALAGNYDWFYEGFTMYQALAAAVRLDQNTFQDYLNALARAYDIYLGASERQKLSLLEASRRRWSGATGIVYRKGMLVAFLYDLSLRQLSKGKRTLDDVYRALFRQANGVRRDGNEVLLELLKSEKEMQDFVRRYIEGADEIELAQMLAPFGLTLMRTGARSQISVSASLSRQQRDLLSAFGYNERARRGGRKS